MTDEESNTTLQDTLQVIEEMSHSTDQHEPENNDASDTSPLLPTLQRHQERVRRQRQVRRFALVFTVLFIFTSIALTVLYFVSPILIRWKVSDKALHGSDGTSIHPMRIRNVHDDQFTVDMRIIMKLHDSGGLPWGGSVSVDKVRIDYQNRQVATAEIMQPVNVTKHSDTFVRSNNLTAVVTITDGHRFGQIVNGLLTEDTVMVLVSMRVQVRPDYFVKLPAISVDVSVPITGIPVLLNSTENQPKAPFVDIIKGTKEWLYLEAVSPVSGVQFGVDVVDPHRKELIAQVTLKDKLVSIQVPRMNRSIQKLLHADGKSTVKIVGAPSRTAGAFKPIAAGLSGLLTLPTRGKPPNLIDSIRITSLLGGSDTTVTNPFSVDITMKRVKQLHIYYEKQQVATVTDADVNAVIEAKGKQQSIKVNSGKFRFTGGLKGAMKLVKDIRRDGYILASVSGVVSVSVGGYEIDDLPVDADSVKITY